MSRMVSIRARRARMCRPWSGHHLHRMPRSARWIWIALLAAATYYAGAQLGFALTFPDSPLSIIWPPNAFLFVVLLLIPLRMWWVALAAVAPAHLLVAWQNGLPATATVGLYVSNCAEALLAAALVRRFAGGPPWLVGLRRMVVYVGSAIVMAPLVTSFLDAGVQVATGLGHDYWLLWQERLLSDALTLLTVPPALLAAASYQRSRLRRVPPLRVLEAALLAVGLFTAGFVVFGPLGLRPIAEPTIVYEMLPLLLWAAVRFGVGGTSAALLGVTLLASSWSASQGAAPSGTSSSVVHHILMMQAQLLAMSIPILWLAAVIQERTQALQALQASEARYRDLVETQTELICRYLPDTTLTFVNDAFCRWYQQPREQLLGRRFIDFMDGAAREHHLRYTAALQAHAHSETDEHVVALPDGSIGWQQWTDHPILDAAGQVVEVQAVGRDVTERKRLEQEREEARAEAERRSEELDRVFDTMADAVIVYDAQGRTVRTNAAAHQLIGLDAAPSNYFALSGNERVSLFQTRDAHGRHLAPDDLASRRALRGEVLTGASALDITSRTLEGRELTFSVSAAPLRDAAGRILGAVAIARDQTERVRMEEALRASEARYRAVVQTQTELISRIAPDMTITFVNEAMCRYLGKSQEELVGTRVIERLPESTRRRSETKIQSLLTQPQVLTAEQEFTVPDGSTRWLAWVIQPILDTNGQVVELQGSGRDITERKQAEEALERLTARLLQVQDEERRRLARDLHDGTAQTLAALGLNLTTLRGLADNGVRDTMRFGRLLADSQALGEQVMREMRTMSYLLHPPQLDEAGLVPAVQWYVKGFSQRSGIRVDLVAPEDLDRLPAEVESALFRVIQECLTNVHRHSGSSIARIELKRSASAVHLHITDAGRGLGDTVPDNTQGAFNDVNALGVGIPGMRQRLHQLGGGLAIRSTQQGTIVTAMVPIQREAFSDVRTQMYERPGKPDLRHMT